MRDSPASMAAVPAQAKGSGARFEDGTDGLAYLLKERVGDLDEVLRAVREVVAGRSVVDPQVVEALVGRRRRRKGVGAVDVDSA